MQVPKLLGEITNHLDSVLLGRRGGYDPLGETWRVPHGAVPGLKAMPSHI